MYPGLKPGRSPVSNNGIPVFLNNGFPVKPSSKE